MLRSRVRLLSASLSAALLVLALVCFFGLVQSARAGSASPPGATSGRPFLYAANSGTPPLVAESNSKVKAPKGAVSFSSIWAYSIDMNTGALTPIAGSPFQTGLDTNSITVDPAGRFLYVTEEDVDTIRGFAINPTTGFLTPIPGSPFSVAESAPNGVTVHPNGNLLYATGEDTGTIYAFTINQTTGALSTVPGSPFAAGNGTDWVTISPNGKFAYATNGSDDTVSGYKVNQTTGVLTEMSASPFNTGGRPDSAVVSADNKFLYVANYSDGTISVFSIDPTSGELTEITDSPFNDNGGPDHILNDKSGKYIYTANDQCGKLTKTAAVPQPCVGGVGAFRIDSSTGDLTPITGSAFIAGFAPSGTMVDGSNKYLYAANEGPNSNTTSTISGFRLNGSTGELTPVAGSPFASGFEPVKIAITPLAAPPAQVPEGDTLMLVGTGLASLAGYATLRWRARRATSVAHTPAPKG